MRSSFQFQMNKKESAICEFEIGFKKSFCWRPNLSNIDTIFVHVNMYVGFCDQESKNPALEYLPGCDFDFRRCQTSRQY